MSVVAPTLKGLKYASIAQVEVFKPTYTMYCNRCVHVDYISTSDVGLVVLNDYTDYRWIVRY